MDEITIKTPASSANLGSGFDVCGVALERPFDIIKIKKAKKLTIKNIGRFVALSDPKESVFAAVIKKMREDFGFKENFQIIINKNIRHKGGLGASASEAVGAAFGLNELLRLNLSKREIVHYAAFGEEFIDGSRHLDNVAPCTYGGFTISYCNNPVSIKHISVPENLECLIIIPDKEKPSTRYAREVLPENVKRQDALYNNFCLAKLICGFMGHDTKLIVDSLDDKIVEPSRTKAGLLLNLEELKKIGRKYGYGVAASGAGPTLIAFGDEKNVNKKIFERKVRDLFEKEKIKSEFLWTRPSNGGVSFS
ncbi:MAG: homoserine kinase [bacterium]|nr:homoserine kinase [bacterium]